MRLLVLGGTGFVGGATVAEAVRRGWSVTVFNRGLHGAVPPGVHRLRGDRSAPDGLAALADGEWDLVVDTWDGAPRAARDAARALVDAVGHYTYVSSGSVYADPVVPGSDETAPVADADPDAVDGDYQHLKAGAERAVRAVFGDRALIARAGLILGPGEDIGRLPWWLSRMARGGDVLAPGPAELPIQCIDVRDLAGWMLDQGARRRGGTFNAVSRPGPRSRRAPADPVAVRSAWTRPGRPPCSPRPGRWRADRRSSDHLHRDRTGGRCREHLVDRPARGGSARLAVPDAQHHLRRAEPPQRHP